MVALIAKLAGADIEPEIRGAGTPAGEIDRQFVDGAKILAVCGWRPGVGLEQGLERTIAWYREHPESLAPVPG